MANHRLFVALRPPVAVRATLLARMGGVPEARWQDDAQLHCTLRFLGDCDRHRAEDVAALLGHVHHPPLDLVLGTTGLFDKAGRIDTLWIAVQPKAAVAALHAKIGRVLRQAGLAPDPRAFVPHVTLARFARGAGIGPEVAQAYAAPVGTRFVAEHFLLFESHLGANGATYEPVARYPLAG